MSSVFFSAKAQEDLDSICAYIHRDNPAAAGLVRQSILDAAGTLVLHPERGPALTNPKPRHRGIRLLVVKQHLNYLLIYRAEPDRILVLRILHAAQDWTRFFR